MPLPKTTKNDFLAALKNKPLDNINIINLIESELKINGGIFTMPKPGSSVVLLLSGGLDSIVSWAILMEEFKLNVYPVIIKNRQKKWNGIGKSIKYFSNFYKKKYSELYNKPFYVFDDFPQIELEKLTKKVHPLSLLETFLGSNLKKNLNLSLASMSLPFLGKNYADYLFFTKNIKINTIFCGILSSDGNGVNHQTFTAIRTNTWYLRVISGEKKWQFASICYEKEIGNMFIKSDLIKWAFEYNIPVEKTWSCYSNNDSQCGKCLACLNRKYGFEKAGILDKTIYLNVENPVLRRIKNRLKKYIDKYFF